MTDCPRIGKLFGGCKFTARYDKVAPTAAAIDAVGVALTEDLKALQGRRYICDVCGRCGKILFRRKTSAATSRCP